MSKKHPAPKLLLLTASLVFASSVWAANADEAEQQEPQGETSINSEKMLEGFILAPTGESGSPELFLANCASCHGEQLEGTGIGVPLAGGDLKHGETIDDILRAINEGFPAAGMPPWADILSPTDARQIALYVTNYRAAQKLAGVAGLSEPVAIPEAPIASEVYSVQVEMLTPGLHLRPYSIAPLSDGSMLLTEKMLGMSIVAPDGTKSRFITGTPKVYNDSPDMYQGLGWLLDVAPHPDYANNGWIYLHFTERCEDCNELSRAENTPVSMNKVVRGRIKDGAWVDQETIWETDLANYTYSTDVGAAGRLAFDDQGHLFFGVGVKSKGFFEGIQDLGQPYGKIFRVNDDGSIPEDNPFYNTEGALKEIWTLGHRTPEGLEYDPKTGQLWETEMGPMGGDELNLLEPGQNYGWPLTSLGLHYDGTAVDHGEELGVEWNMEDIRQPVLDLTPSPAVSSFIIYDGDEFPEWKGNLLVANLKAQELYRFVLEDNQVVHRETVLQGLGRIRDIEADADGVVYLLLENVSEGQIVRLTNAGGDAAVEGDMAE